MASIKTFENSFKYVVDYDHSGHNDCEGNGCDDEGICRCYRIESVSIDKVDLKAITRKIVEHLKSNEDKIAKQRESALKSILFGYDIDELDFYCIYRVLSILKIWDTENWEAEWGGGYYGDEVEEIKLYESLFDKLISTLDEILSLNTIGERMELLMKLEYGHLDSKLIGKKYTIESVSYEDIVFGQSKHHELVKTKNLSYLEQSKWIKTSSKENVHGFVLFDGEKYRVIDGYHRLTFQEKFIHKKNKLVKVIVAK